MTPKSWLCSFKIFTHFCHFWVIFGPEILEENWRQKGKKKSEPNRVIKGSLESLHQRLQNDTTITGNGLGYFEIWPRKVDFALPKFWPIFVIFGSFLDQKSWRKMGDKGQKIWTNPGHQGVVGILAPRATKRHYNHRKCFRLLRDMTPGSWLCSFKILTHFCHFGVIFGPKILEENGRQRAENLNQSGSSGDRLNPCTKGYKTTLQSPEMV